ncbi:MAG: 2,3-bisphosphoglycerate-independent phosphoglycerate mutase [Candidatus Micrarchaeota archaeon]|nr:2,3-bisphosphoglycerate-independent phosphoglycerate mutase [Candidatus Micrarchaeota archaeon]
MKRILFVVIDGLADTGNTPLMNAEKPNLDFLASEGICGLVDNEVSGTDFSETANFHFLGYTEFPGRGYVEAVGTGLEPGEKDVCFRCNFSTVDAEMIVLDRRAGREETGLDELADEINKIRIKNCSILFKRGLGHRGVLILRGEVNEHVTGTDPLETGERVRESKPTLPEAHPLFPDALRTSKILNEFTRKTFEVLSEHPINSARKVPANIILSRNPGRKMVLKPFYERYGMRAVCISAVPATIGMAKILGMDTLRVGTGNTSTDLKSKVEKTLQALSEYDFVFLHIKGCDVAAHDRNCEEKRRFIERIDSEFFGRLLPEIDENTIITVLSDHVTSCSDGQHKTGYVPILIYGSGRDGVKRFDEISVREGDIGLIHASDLMEKLISLR